MRKTYRARALRWIGIRVRSPSAISHRSLLLRIWTVRTVLLHLCVIQNVPRREHAHYRSVSMLTNTNAISDTLKSNVINYHTSITVIVIVSECYLYTTV